MTLRVLAFRQIMLAGGEEGGTPDAASLRYRHKAARNQSGCCGLENEICPPPIGTAIADPTQNFELAMIERSIECHVGNRRTLLAALQPRHLCFEFLDPPFERSPCRFSDG
ncbi:hypothetical protein AWC27_19720 [Mycobacterium szulgai]|uniref:Uncharacterized protein n=1 Tax=Mycobacterium szulgai TaxID=1787 RepID=A0A1X2F862_MYCSZ|nr:hypothetical protein AWC27_19720 [Mycobacterium szulgai]